MPIVSNPVTIKVVSKMNHYPVMHKEVLEFLAPISGNMVLDCTVGLGGHAEKILDKILPEGFLFGIDQDEEALLIADRNLKKYEKNMMLTKGNFQDVDDIIFKFNAKKFDCILFDLGVSWLQIGTPERGFSFLNEGPLDMRMDRDKKISAFDIINNLAEEELSDIIKVFGEEKFHKRIAHCIVKKRRQEVIETTAQLADLIKFTVPPKYRYGRIHPATRTFQAFRIAVNRELASLEKGLEKAVSFLKKGGRISVISFHSMEDRIVKHMFRQFSKDGILEILTKKPLTPSKKEIEENAKSRSAKLRVAKKI